MNIKSLIFTYFLLILHYKMAARQTGTFQKRQANIGKQESSPSPVVLYLDIPKSIQDFIVEQSDIVLRQFNKGEKKYFSECAESIKKLLDETYGGSYHVIIGKDFGSFFNYEVGHCFQFMLGAITFLIFKHG